MTRRFKHWTLLACVWVCGAVPALAVGDRVPEGFFERVWHGLGAFVGAAWKLGAEVISGG